ncbi:hypothetical protein BDF19DRAFT_38634 [Syncephalis fuscata]|nr:hypothetical protein BDF19DRAFT_38634 [Syncephalis fuscata]
MLFQGAGETYADLSDFRVAPLKLVGVELEYKASKNDPNKAVNTTRRPGVVRQSRAPHSNRHSGINMRANVAHADPGACRWYIVLVRPASLRRPASIVAAEPLSPNSTLYTAKHEEATTSGLVLASSLSSSCLSFKCYSSGEEDDNASTNDGISIFNNVSGQTKQHHADCTSDEPYMVRRTFYQFRLLIVGLYREFLDKPNIIAPLREAATDIFSACPEAERLCVHALLDVFLIVSPEQAALLGSRSVAEFFSKWPADRTREELEQATSDINGCLMHGMTCKTNQLTKSGLSTQARHLFGQWI